MLLVKGFNKFFNATKENNSLEIMKDFSYNITNDLSFLGLNKVVNDKVNNR